MIELDYQLERALRQNTKNYLTNQLEYLKSTGKKFIFSADEIKSTYFDPEVLKLMQTEISLERIAYEAVCDLNKMNVKYAELAIEPYLHIQNGLTQKEVVLATIAGISRGVRENPSVKVKLELSLLRGLPEYINQDTCALAASLRSSGMVVGINVLGDTPTTSLTKLDRVYQWARLNNLAITMECTSETDVLAAIQSKTNRIVASCNLKDPRTLKQLREENIVVVCNVSRNMDSGKIPGEVHPIGIIVTSGVMAVSCFGEQKYMVDPNHELDSIKMMGIDSIRVLDSIKDTTDYYIEKYYK